MQVKADLYRHYDANGRQLYVGISLDAVLRLSQHKRFAEWHDLIASIKIVKFPDRVSAESAERQAIINEGSLFNTAGNPDQLDASTQHIKAAIMKVYTILESLPEADARQVKASFELAFGMDDILDRDAVRSWLDHKDMPKIKNAETVRRWIRDGAPGLEKEKM